MSRTATRSPDQQTRQDAGRPVLSMAEKLQRRKLDALRRGVHRLSQAEPQAIATHVVGIGAAGAGAIAEVLRALDPDAPKLRALAIAVGDQDLAELRTLAAGISAERAEVVSVALDVPDRDDLFDVLRRYPEFLQLEYPRYTGGAGYRPWLQPDVALPGPDGATRRAVAKAIYGRAYYSGSRGLEKTLRTFMAGVDAANVQAVVAVVFALADPAGSGIAVDLARHLSNGMFGRRALIAGIGIAPCDGDPGGQAGAHLFPVLNELDCLGDEDKNKGVVQSCGDLFKNPFTAGFIMVPQQHVWESTKDLALTRRRVEKELAALLVARGGANIWEMLRLLNWVAAPSTQHSAARTPWGPQWIHMLGFADDGPGALAVGPDFRARLGLLPSHTPEYLEVRVADPAAAAAAGLTDALGQAFAPAVAPQLVEGGRPGSVQLILPRIAKTDLAWFAKARAAYDAAPEAERLLDHAMLLEQGLMLSEPSTRLQGMAGAGLAGGDRWVAVPLAALRGEREPPLQAAS